MYRNYKLTTHCASNVDLGSCIAYLEYTEYVFLVINIVFIRYIFNELYAYIIYYL